MSTDHHESPLVTPFVGLAMASAPGLTHYLPFLRPVTRDNGIVAGIVEGIVPTLGISSILFFACWMVKSRSRASERGLELIGRGLWGRGIEFIRKCHSSTEPSTRFERDDFSPRQSLRLLFMVSST
jgi:hypothetical protein